MLLYMLHADTCLSRGCHGREGPLPARRVALLTDRKLLPRLTWQENKLKLCNVLRSWKLVGLSEACVKCLGNLNNQEAKVNDSPALKSTDTPYQPRTEGCRAKSSYQSVRVREKNVKRNVPNFRAWGSRLSLNSSPKPIMFSLRRLKQEGGEQQIQLPVEVTDRRTPFLLITTWYCDIHLLNFLLLLLWVWLDREGGHSHLSCLYFVQLRGILWQSQSTALSATSLPCSGTQSRTWWAPAKDTNTISWFVFRRFVLRA